MGIRVEQGICKLCLQEKMLCDSHLAPAGLYKYCAARELGPVRFTANKISAGNRETSAYVLCQECENLLNREGENWLLPKLATIEKKFPFYDLVVSVLPDTVEDGVAAYACSRNNKIGFRKLTNFAIGVFWKASVHSWEAGNTEPMIDLGKYQEQFRAFLADRKPFPAKACLVIGVTMPEKAVIGFNMPVRRGVDPYHQYVFWVPGIIFVLSVGNRLSEMEKQICFFSNPLHPIIVADFSKDIFGLLRKAIKGAIPSPEVADFLKRPRTW
jgi:hypothetical protein